MMTPVSHTTRNEFWPESRVVVVVHLFGSLSLSLSLSICSDFFFIFVSFLDYSHRNVSKAESSIQEIVRARVGCYYIYYIVVVVVV